MTEQSFTNKPSRTKRKEALWRGVTLFVGCAAVVMLIAALVFVVSQRVLRGPGGYNDEEYLTSQYGLEGGRNWSGETRTAPALFDHDKAKADAKNGTASTAPSTGGTEVRTSVTSVTPTPPAPAADGPAGIVEIEAKRDKIADTVRAFFQAATLEDRLKQVRDPQRVKPLMEAYYKREPMTVYRLRDLGWMVRVDEPGYRFGYVQALFEDATPSSLVVEESVSGQMLIDWECLVRYGELAWHDFLRMKPAQPTLMRLIASRPVSRPLVSGDAGESGEWLELRHPAESGTILGYFDKDDPKFANLLEQMTQGKWKDVPVTLRLCFPEPPSQTNGTRVQIADIEGKGWLILNSKPQS